MGINKMDRAAFRKRFLSKMQKVVYAHKRLYIPCVIISAVVLVAYRLAESVVDNRKRLIAGLSAVLCFFASSSFAFPTTSINTGFVSDVTAYDSVLGAEESPSSLVSTSSIKIDAYQVVDEVQEYSFLFADEILTDDIETDATESGKEEGIVKEEDQYGLSDLMGSMDEGLNAITEEETGVINSDSEEASFSADDWQLILVNKQHPIPSDYEFPLSRIKGNMYCDERIRASLLQMFQDAEADGVTLVICSPYRSMSHQERLFSNKIDLYMSEGMDYMSAYTTAAMAVTIPGSSEHQIGLAVDIISNTYASLDDGFGDTQAGKWLAANAHNYGFILRYPEGDEEITGIEYEPWHFRYVGKDAAAVIYEDDICLEEFWNNYIYSN